MGASLASRNRRSEDVRILPIVVAELEFSDVEWQILFADLMEASHDTALNQRPETLDCLCVNRADDVMSVNMANDAVRKPLSEIVIGIVIVGAKQAYFGGNGLADKFVNRCLICAKHDTSDYIAFALYGTNDGRFSFVIAAPASVTPLVPMAVFVLSADVGFINFDNAAKFLGIFLNERASDFVAHFPGGFVRAKTHVTHDLKRTHALFTGQHKVGNSEPSAKWFISVLKDCPDQKREAVPVGRTFLALPMPFAGWQIVNGGIAAAGTVRAFGPTAGLEIGPTGVLVGEQVLEFSDAKLVNGFGPFGTFCHNTLPIMEGYCHG